MIYDTLLWLEIADRLSTSITCSLIGPSQAPRILVFPHIRSGATADPGGCESLAESGFGIPSKDVTIHLFSSPLGKIWRSRAKAFQWMPRVRSHLGTVASIQNSNVIRLRLNLRSLRFTGQPINPSKVGNFKLGWCQEFQNVRGSLVGSCWLYSLNIGNKNRGYKESWLQPKKGDKKNGNDFASLTGT